MALARSAVPTEAAPTTKRRVQLPSTSDRSQRGRCYLRLLTEVLPAKFGAGFEGPIYRPGASVSSDEFPDPAVILECGGKMGKWRPGKPRPTVWLLWRLDRSTWTWEEIARASAYNWEWAITLRPVAIRALNPRPVLMDVHRHCASVAEELVTSIDRRLVREPEELKINVLSELYDLVAGRLAQLQ